MHIIGTHFIEQVHHILSKEQNGYVNKRSTMKNMLNFFYDLTNYYTDNNNKYKVDVIYTLRDMLYCYVLLLSLRHIIYYVTYTLYEF